MIMQLINAAIIIFILTIIGLLFDGNHVDK